MSDYSDQRHTERVHRRVVRQGSEHFEARVDDLAIHGGYPDVDVDDVSNADDVDEDGSHEDHSEDRHLLEEIPPHWAIFNRRD